MHRGLLIPTERPPTDIDIKRALLTLEQVHVLAPEDRELIPPDQFQHASALIHGGMSLPFFMNQGPVLPLGKIPRFDEMFSQTIETCRAAEQQGLLVVRQPPRFNMGFALGGSPTPEGWPASAFTLGVFKALGSDPAVISKVLAGVADPATVRDWDLDALVPAAAMRDVTTTVGGEQPSTLSLNTLAAMPNLPEAPPDLLPVYARLGAARLGAIVKTLGICHIGEILPVSMDSGVNSILDHVQGTAGSTLQTALAAEDDPEAVRLALRVERLLYEHFIPDQVLGAMSFEEVLKLRTKAWGKAGEHKIKLFQIVRALAREVKSDAEFDKRAAEEIAAYQKANTDFFDELKSIGARATVWIAGGESAAAITSVQTALGLSSWEATLIIAAGVALKEVASNAVAIWRELSEMNASIGKTLLRPYEGIAKK